MNTKPTLTFADAAAIVHPFYFAGPVPVPPLPVVAPLTIEIIDAEGVMGWHYEPDEPGTQFAGQAVCTEVTDFQAIIGGKFCLSMAECQSLLLAREWREALKLAKQFVEARQ